MFDRIRRRLGWITAAERRAEMQQNINRLWADVSAIEEQLNEQENLLKDVGWRVDFHSLQGKWTVQRLLAENRAALELTKGRLKRMELENNPDWICSESRSVF